MLGEEFDGIGVGQPIQTDARRILKCNVEKDGEQYKV